MSKMTAATCTARTLLSGIVTTVAASAQTSPQTSLIGEPAAFEGGLHEVAPGTFAWLQPNGDLGESNAGLVVGAGASTLIDTLWDVRLTRRMLDAMAPHVAEAPISHLVNTHSDGDHWWGNQLLPDARRITSAASAEVMRHEEGAPEQFERLRNLAAKMLRASQLGLPGGVRRRLGDFGSYVTSMFAPYDFSNVELTGPTETFAGHVQIGVGGRPLELIVVGPAHTPGDAIVWLPDVRVVFAADVAFIGVTPVMWAGPVGNWLAALDRIAALEPEVVVPGHGPVCGLAELEAVGRYWRWLDAATRPRFARGESPYEAAAGIALSDGFREQEWAGWSSPERIVINCHILRREARDELGPITPAQRIVIFDQVARLAAQLRGR
jgi:glyoxylase-like metal-dependent hydrolase (beta-lactamase superfamily II)